MMINRLTKLAMQLISAIDSGRYDDIPVAEIRRHIRNGDLLEYLEGRMYQYVDGRFLEPTEKLELAMDLAQLEAKRSPCHDFGVEKNGLCLLLGYLLDSIDGDYAEIVDNRIRNGLGLIEAPMVEDEFLKRMWFRKELGIDVQDEPS
jgi:hypothetical protein